MYFYPKQLQLTNVFMFLEMLLAWEQRNRSQVASNLKGKAIVQANDCVKIEMDKGIKDVDKET